MPSKSWSQHKLMMGVAHSPKFAREVGIKQSVGRDFAAADDAAGITKHPTMPKREIKKRIKRMRKDGSKRSPVRGLRSHAEFEKLGR